MFGSDCGPTTSFVEAMKRKVAEVSAASEMADSPGDCSPSTNKQNASSGAGKPAYVGLPASLRASKSSSSCVLLFSFSLCLREPDELLLFSYGSHDEAKFPRISCLIIHKAQGGVLVCPHRSSCACLNVYIWREKNLIKLLSS